MVCAVYRALPTLGWRQMRTVFPGHVAALAMVLLGGGLGTSNSSVSGVYRVMHAVPETTYRFVRVSGTFWGTII